MAILAAALRGRRPVRQRGQGGPRHRRGCLPFAVAFGNPDPSTLAATQRGGILYGTVDEEKNVIVEAIYEPPQSATATSLQLERGTEEEQRADYLAKLLGWAAFRSCCCLGLMNSTGGAPVLRSVVGGKQQPVQAVAAAPCAPECLHCALSLRFPGSWPSSSDHCGGSCRCCSGAILLNLTQALLHARAGYTRSAGSSRRARASGTTSWTRRRCSRWRRCRTSWGRRP